MKRLLPFCTLQLLLLIGSGPLFAHHGRGQMFDMQREVTLKGRVSEVGWRNPHVVIYMDVVGENGEAVTWSFENASVSTLARQGYNRNTLKIGQDITAVVNPSASGAPLGIVVFVTLEDGTEIMSRRSGENPVD